MKHSKRIGWVDTAKGVGIVLVVIGHTYWGRPSVDVIYLFHMPMFFILSGVVYRPEPVSRFIHKRAQSLLLPYVAFLAIVMVLQNCLAIRHASLSRIIGGDMHQLARDAFGGRSLTGDFGTFWFVPCLFIALITYNALRQRISDPISPLSTALALGLLTVSYLVSAISLPLDASIVPMAMFFIWAGEAWSAMFVDRSHSIVESWIVLGVALLVTLGGCIYLAPFDMKLGQYGTPILSIFAAVAMTHIFFHLCMRLAKIRLVGQISASVGQSTLVILFTHRLIVLHLRHAVPDVAIVLIATVIPYLAWLAIRAGPPKMRRFLLGELPQTFSHN